MDAAALKAALAEAEPDVSWRRCTREFQVSRHSITVDADLFVTLYEAAESQLKAMTGEG